MTQKQKNKNQKSAFVTVAIVPQRSVPLPFFLSLLYLSFSPKFFRTADEKKGADLLPCYIQFSLSLFITPPPPPPHLPHSHRAEFSSPPEKQPAQNTPQPADQ